MSTTQPAALRIPPSGGDLDFLALGALIHRLDPGVVPFHKAQTLSVHVSGGEFNCAANLSDCFRLKTGIATAMVDYPIGDLIAERVQAMGVRPFYKMFTHDGAWGPNMAAVYSDRGFGVRPPVVFYNRSNEAATLLKPGDFDWAAIFAKGVRWFHSGGLFTALGEGTDEVIIEAMQAAKKAGAVVSFDLNYREKLWNARGGNEKALDVFKKIIQYVDVLDDAAEDRQGSRRSARRAPELFTVVEIERHDRAVGLRGLHRFDNQVRGGRRQRRKDAAAVKPADARAKDRRPVEVTRLEPRRGFVAAVVEDDGRTHAVTAIAVDGGHVRAPGAVVLEQLVERRHTHRAHAPGN